MGVHRAYGQKDEQDAPVGDIGFLGVDDRTDPRRVEPGMVAFAQNKDFADGTAATRLGWMTTAWGGVPGVHFDTDFDETEEGISFDPDVDGAEEGLDFETVGFGEIFGHLVFSDPYGNESLLLACSSGVWSVRNYGEAALIRLPDRATIDYPVRMIQCFDKVLMLRGTDRTVLEWSGAYDFEAGIGEFQEIAQTGSGTYTETIPNAEYGFSFGNRAWILKDRDTLCPSDVLDYTRWNSAFNNLRINAGTDDAIMAGVGGKDNRILVMKRRSAYVVDGVYGSDLGFSATAQEVTRERGLIGRDAIADMGAGEWAYLSDGGVYTIRMTDENKLRSSPAPLSWPIKGLMDRVHWPFAYKAILQVHEERLYCAVPVDGSQGCNALFVFNLTTKKWEGMWTADYLKIVGLPIVTENGQKRLCILNGTGTSFKPMWRAEIGTDDEPEDTGLPTTLHGPADGAILVTGEGYADFVYGFTVWIEDEVVTRGYGLQTLQQVKQIRASLDQETWDPNFSVFTRRGGVDGETAVVENVKRGFEREITVEQGVKVVEGHLIPDDPDWLLTDGDSGGIVQITWTWVGAANDLEDYLHLQLERWIILGADPEELVTWDVLVGTEIVSTVTGYLTNAGLTLHTNSPCPVYSIWRITLSSVTDSSYLYHYLLSRGVLTDTVTPSRHQQIYGADEVLWSEGSSPAEIEGEGYDDYSWRLGTGILPGVTLGRMQRQTEIYKIRKRGDFVQLRTTNVRGRHVLHATQLDGLTGRRGLRSRIA